MALFRLDAIVHTDDDDSTVVITWGGGVGTFAIQGIIDGATMNLEVSYDSGTTWFAVGADTSLAAAPGHGNFDLPADVLLRGTSAGGSSAVDLVVWILPRRPTA